jgi:hypothetical protein
LFAHERPKRTEYHRTRAILTDSLTRHGEFTWHRGRHPRPRD